MKRALKFRCAAAPQPFPAKNNQQIKNHLKSKNWVQNINLIHKWIKLLATKGLTIKTTLPYLEPGINLGIKLASEFQVLVHWWVASDCPAKQTLPSPQKYSHAKPSRVSRNKNHSIQVRRKIKNKSRVNSLIQTRHSGIRSARHFWLTPLESRTSL